MTGINGRFLRKLNFIPTLKQGLLDLQLQYPPDNNNNNNICISQHVKALEDHEEEIIDFMKFKASSSSDTETESLSEAESDHDDDALTETEPEPEPESTMEQHKCPPGGGGGSGCVILYTTSLRSIRKTFEDCKTIGFLLESHGVKFHERDVSMDMEMREELWRVMGGRVVPPRLFIKGRYIGGADEVVTLHEQGRLRGLLDGLPLHLSKGPCKGCGNMRFVVCSHCNGSCKVVVAQEEINRCPHCNENGLVKCPICQ